MRTNMKELCLINKSAKSSSKLEEHPSFSIRIFPSFFRPYHLSQGFNTAPTARENSKKCARGTYSGAQGLRTEASTPTKAANNEAENDKGVQTESMPKKARKKLKYQRRKLRKDLRQTLAATDVVDDQVFPSMQADTEAFKDNLHATQGSNRLKPIIQLEEVVDELQAEVGRLRRLLQGVPRLKLTAATMFVKSAAQTAEGPFQSARASMVDKDPQAAVLKVEEALWTKFRYEVIQCRPIHWDAT